MPVEQPNDDYSRWQPTWQKCRDAVEGEDQVKQKNTVYLPMLNGQDQEEYDAYKTRATFYAASERTVKGLAGAVMRKAPNLIFPDSASSLLDTIGADDESIDMIAKEVLEEVLTTGRPGIYLDAPDEGSDNPYICVYYPENIINWRSQRVGGKNVMTLVVLRESYQEDTQDDFVTKKKDRYRVLKLDVTTDNPVFSVELWEEADSKEEGGSDKPTFILANTITPKMKGGRTLNYIPFLFVSSTGVSAEVDKPPLLDLVNMNYSHYRSSADLEHGLHYTALPTAWVAGFDSKGSRLKIGSGTAWVSDDPSAHAGYLEFSGAGLKAISDALESKEQKMSILGARLLEDQKNAAEAATTVALRHSGERSVLANIALAVSEGFTQILQWTADWMGLSDANLAAGKGTSISYVLNQDFNNTPIDPTLFQQMMAALQGGFISWDTWFYFLSKGGVYPDNWTEDDEREKIALGGPVSPMLPAGTPSGNLPIPASANGPPKNMHLKTIAANQPPPVPQPGQKGKGPANPQSGQGFQDQRVNPIVRDAQQGQ